MASRDYTIIRHERTARARDMEVRRVECRSGLGISLVEKEGLASPHFTARRVGHTSETEPYET